MLSYNELKPGTIFIYNDEPFMVTEYNFMRMQQRKPVAQTKIKSLISGKTINQTFYASDTFEEANLEYREIKYLYNNRGQYFFCEKDDPSKRFQLTEDILGDKIKFLKPNSLIKAVQFDEKIINIELPNKMDFLVTEAPPNIKGNTAQGGNKPVTIETGAKINTPMFVETGDTIKVNTQTGEYTERVSKG